MRNKIELRAELVARRAKAFAAWPAAGQRLAANFPAFISISNLAVVAGYMPFRTEIDPLPLLHASARRGAQCVLPRMNSAFPLWGEVGAEGGVPDTSAGFAKKTAPHPPTPAPQGRRGAALLFHLCDFDNNSDFQTNKWGLLEPLPNLPFATPSLLLVPLLGFDRHGNRIGYGKGYYDQTIAYLRATASVTTIGLAFAEQEVAEIPTQPHDQRLDWIITQNEAYRVPS